MDRAEALERSTKAKGQRDGVLGQSALMVLRALLCHFLDTQERTLDPSYKQIQKQTGFCVQTIAVALKRLERAGILEITRRIARIGAKLWNEFTGRFVWRERVEQQTNAYMVNVPVPDRTEFGDFGMPLFKPKHDVHSDSTSQRESTSRFLHRVSAAQAAGCSPGELRGDFRPSNPNSGLERPILEPDTAQGGALRPERCKAARRAANLRRIDAIHRQYVPSIQRSLSLANARAALSHPRRLKGPE